MPVRKETIKFAQGRLGFANISDYLSCPVIGACLSLGEQKKLLKKSRIDIREMTDYKIHEKLVNSRKSESPLTRRIQQYLDRKYPKEVAEFGLCSEEDFFRAWRKSLKTGEIEGLLWAGATNPFISFRGTRKIFADMHMLNHLQGKQTRKAIKENQILLEKNKSLKTKLKAAQKRANESAQTVTKLEHTHQTLAAELETARQEIRTLKAENDQNALKQENERLQTKLEKTENILQTRIAALEKAEEENKTISEALDTQTKINQHAKVEINQLIRKVQFEEANCQTCPNRDLCDRRVLLVGGLTSLQTIYRSLVEDYGGEFKYHDGKLSNGERVLENMVGWADVILCPVDVNSHNAALGVKKLCKKMDKPYVILRSSSVTSIATALDTVAEKTDTV